MNRNDTRFFPVFLGATLGVVLEEIATLVDETVIGNISTDEAFAAVNLVEPYVYLEIFIGYLICVAAAAFIVRSHGAGDNNKMSELFSQTLIVCGIVGVALTSIYVIFTPQLIQLVADDPAVYDGALEYFSAMRFYPLVDLFDTFMFTYVLYRGGYVHFYVAIVCRISINALLSWQLGLQMGLMGVGLASIISIVVALIIKLTFLFGKKHGLKFRWYLNPKEVWIVLKTGFPESTLALFIVLMEMFINNYTLETYGALGVAAVAVVINVFEFVLYMSEGISEYEVVAVNDSIGKKSKESFEHAIKTTKRAILIEGAVLMVIILCTSDFMPSFFDIDDEETAKIASMMLMIIAPSTIFICLSRVIGIFYQYTQRITRAIIIFGMSVMGLPVMLGMLFGQVAIEGIAVGMAVGPLVAIMLMYGYVKGIKKEKLFEYNLQ